jgi:proline iminopeptidase
MKKLTQKCKGVLFRYTLIILLLFTSFNSIAQLYPHEGYINVKGGKVWYRIVGSGSNTPLILLHGGPGATSYYLNPIAP